MDLADFKDLSKKYTGTYIQYRLLNTENEWNTCYVEDLRIWYAETDEQVDFYTVISRQLKLKSTEYEFKFDFPPIGVLNYKDTVVITNKYPQRQWKKAACSDNFVVALPTAQLLEHLRWKYVLPKITIFSFSWNTSNVHLLFKDSYFTYKDALLLLRTGKRMACAINNEFFITNSHYNKSVLLWRCHCIVAEIHEKEVIYLEELFKQEVIDFFKRNV